MLGTRHAGGKNGDARSIPPLIEVMANHACYISFQRFFFKISFFTNYLDGQRAPDSPSLRKSHSLVSSLSNLRSRLYSGSVIEEQVEHTIFGLKCDERTTNLSL